MTAKWKLERREDIRETAEGLVEFLKGRIKDSQGGEWTDQNSTALSDFAGQIDQGTTCFHKPRAGHAEDRKEFLWDFLACRPGGGLSIVAESEQETSKASNVVDLQHDFEKLLYVFAPLRVLIAKAKHAGHAKELVDSLTDYANRCALHFNPGSAFILHFCLWNDDEPISYVWQSEGNPTLLKVENIEFGEPI